MILRPYQDETHDALLYHYEKGENRLMAHLATGLGKTSGVAAFLPEKFPDLADKGVVFLSHRREILFQAYQTFKRRWGTEKWIGIEMGEYHCTGEEDFIFCSVDSIGRYMGNRIGKLQHRYPGIIIVDEGHHVSLDGTWDNILNFFGVGSDESQHHTFADGSKPLSVFLTATPIRADGQALLPFCDKIAVSFDINYAIREGWLTDIKAYHAELTNGDYKEFDPEEQVDFLIKTWMKWGKGSRTLAFAKNVAQSQMLAATLEASYGIRAGHVDAKTDDETRQSNLKRFGMDYQSPDSLEFLSNRLVLTEGYDNPMIQTVLDNAPTDSQSLYIQKIGRGLRTDPALDLGAYRTASDRKEAIRTSRKPFLTYITAFPLKHGLDMPATLFGLPKNVDSNGKLLSEVVDVIQYEEEEMPEAPTRDLAGMSSLDITLKRQDLWTQTVYNEELKALTPLRWIMGESFAALRLPMNPWAKGITERTPIIIHFNFNGHDWELHRVLEGGWIQEIKRPARSKHMDMNYVESDIQKGITKVDRWLQEHQPDLFAMMQRDHNGPASSKMKEYLKRKKVKCNFDALTMETAMILKDNALAMPKLESFGLNTD